MVSYRVLGYLGQPEVSPEKGTDTASFEDPFAPLTTSRGFVKVPTYDVRQYVQTTLIVLAVGFGAGVGVGAIFGNILGERKLAGGVGTVFRNRPQRRRRSSRTRRNAGKRRTSARRRKRGRPAGGTVNDHLTVKLPEGFIDVHVDRGDVLVGKKRYGSIYDLGTKFQAVPIRGESRSFGTLAGAVKHVLRHSEAA